MLLGGLALSSAGCKGDAYRESDATPVSVAAPVHSVTVSWTANREHAVNKSGGGYRVYYSTTPGFSVSGASYVDVPYVSGGTAPVSTPITGLVAGTYYIKVVAYSAISAASAPSTEATVTVP